MIGIEKLITIAHILSALLVAVRAVPQVAFPFNSQVPTVARASLPYSFQISASTFEPATESFTYGLLDQPHWLSIKNATRTLTGLPTSSDVGTSIFTLTAADRSGVAYMPCTLVVSSDPAPILAGDISVQIAMSANLSNAYPPIVTLLPTTAFRFDFTRSSFIDILQRNLYFYATLSDHTPLPSWMHFDANNLVFSGVAPELAAFPQSWSIDLMASDVPGFSGSSASFRMAISTEQLVFVPGQQDLFVGAGMPLSYTGLQHQLFRDGKSIDLNALDETKADLPSWLSFNPSTLVIEGVAPTEFEGKIITVSATDRLGNTATATLNIVSRIGSVFSRPIGTITVAPGQQVLYHFVDSLFAISHLVLEAYLPESASWIHFNAPDRELVGTVPANLTSSSIQATLVVQAAGVVAQIQPFVIEVKPASIVASASYTGSTTRRFPTDNPTTVPYPTPSTVSGSTRLHSGFLAAIIVLGMVAAGLLVMCMILWLKQHKRHYRRRHLRSSSKALPEIYAPSNKHPRADSTNAGADVEESGESPVTPLPQRKLESPPQIDLALPLEARQPTSKWRTRTSCNSKVSSLGYGGEDCIGADCNIPELGREVQLLQTPHHSFVVPDEMAKLSRRSAESSPSKTALQKQQNKRRLRPDKGVHGEPGPEQRCRPDKGQRWLRHRRSFGLPAVIASSSLASLSTKAISMLSPKPSDFPRPPVPSSDSGSASLIGQDRLIKRRTIRLVDTSNLWSDDRPIDVKRQSFIRARASSGQPNPLFAHGSRVPSVSTRKTASYAGSTRNAPSARGITTTYSESSSLEPQPRYMRHISCQAPITFPHVISGLTMDVASQSGVLRDSSSGYSTTSSSIEADDLIKQMALPKHQRSWVLPGEASPTPPPLSFARKVQVRSPHENEI